MVVRKLHKGPAPQIQSLYDRGIKSVIPLFGGKNPGYSGWQKITDQEAQEKVWAWEGDKTNVNYGIRLGPQFGEICDIDLDSSEARELARYYLPETSSFGRGGVTTHYLYKVLEGGSGKGKNALASKRYQWDKRDEKSVLLEIRYSGQTMGPGSVHPETQEMVEWMTNVEIRSLDADDLISRVNKLAAASLLLRDWQSGGRDELAVCLVGAMLRAGHEVPDIDAFVEPILVEAGDEESVKRLKAERLATELENGGRVPGLKRLKELCSGGGLGNAGFDRIVEWLGLGGGDLIEEMNQHYALVTLRGGGAAILREREGDAVEFLDQRSFSLLYANRMAMKSGREVTADKFWLQHKDRREYLGGVVFSPGKEVKPDEYNLWKGFTVQAEEGAWGYGWEVFLNHLRDEVCSGNQKIFEWLIGWMAHRVQRPFEVPESAVVLIGERGDGKSTVFKILGSLFGRHYMAVTNPRQLLGNFNAHMMDKVLVLADEAIWGGDKTNEGILKTMISEERRVVEIKGKDAFEVDNCTAYGICSNNDWVVPVGRAERRFLILRTKGGARGDLDYWDNLYSIMSVAGGGLQRMLYDLGKVDLENLGIGWNEWSSEGSGKWRGNKPPRTGELEVQQSRGMEHWVQWVVYAVSEGIISEGNGAWADDLYDEYVAWTQRLKWHIETETIWAKCLGRMFPDMQKVRGRKEVWAGAGSKVAIKKNRLVFHNVERSVKNFLEK
jgi:hypothetical protein